jgi:hypothetical protein
MIVACGRIEGQETGIGAKFSFQGRTRKIVDNQYSFVLGIGFQGHPTGG